MSGRAIAALSLAVAAVAGCSLVRNQRGQGTERCARAQRLVGDAAALRDDGFLGRSLEQVELAAALCPSLGVQRQLAETLADVGLTADAIAAYRLLAESGGERERALAGQAIAELEARPPPTRTASEDDRALAVDLYRDGVNRRFAGDHDESLRQLRRSYALWPDPLTIVQIGLTHDAAGDPIEARRANARALAIAESITGTPAEPRIAGTADHVRAVAAGAQVIASLSAGGVLDVWDGLTGQPRRSFDVGPVDLIAVSPDGASVALGDVEERSVDILDVGTGSVSSSIAAGVDVRVLDLVDGSAAASLALHGGELLALGFDEHGVLAAVASSRYDAVAIGAGGALRAMTTGSPGVEVFGPDGTRAVLASAVESVGAVAFTPDGGHIAVAGPAGLASYDVVTGEPIARIDGCAGATDIAYLGSGSRVVCVVGGKLAFFDAATGAPQTLVRGRRPIRAAVFAGATEHLDLWIEGPTGALERVSAPGGDRSAEPSPVVEPVDHGAVAAVVGPDVVAEVAAFHPTEPLLAVGAAGSVSVYDTETGAQVFTAPGVARRLLFSDDGARLVRIGDDTVDVVRVGAWRLSGGVVESDTIRWADVNRDATLAIVVRADGLATLWDVASMSALATIAGTHDGNWLVMSPSGQVEGAGDDERAREQLYWSVGDSQLPGFVGWQRNAREGLLQSLFDPEDPRAFERPKPWYSGDRLPVRIAIPVGAVGLGFEIYNIVQLVQGELVNPWIGLAEVGFWGTIMWEAGHGCDEQGLWACRTLSVLSGVFAVYGMYSFAVQIDAFEADEAAVSAAIPTVPLGALRRSF